MTRRDPLPQRLGGLLIGLALGFACYWGLPAAGRSTLLPLDYDWIVAGAAQSLPKQLAWFFMNFAEPQFYAGILSGLGVILGGIVAWLRWRDGKPTRFALCGNPVLFPWVLAAQLASLALTRFVFGRFGSYFTDGADWVATFIPVAGAPPAVILLCGPGWRQLFAGSVLGGLFCAPTAVWLNLHVAAPLGLPSVVASVIAMAVTGAVICPVCAALFGVAAPPAQKPAAAGRGVAWRVKRMLADFSEAQFYGNETASLFLLGGVLLETALCAGHGVYGTGLVPAILLSQFTGSAVGIFLYGERLADGYATFIPVVSVGPACVLFYGGGLLPALFAGILGGILGGPTAQMIRGKLPCGVHPTVANVTAMAVCTTLVTAAMDLLPCFSRVPNLA